MFRSCLRWTEKASLISGSPSYNTRIFIDFWVSFFSKMISEIHYIICIASFHILPNQVGAVISTVGGGWVHLLLLVDETGAVITTVRSGWVQLLLLLVENGCNYYYYWEWMDAVIITTGGGWVYLLLLLGVDGCNYYYCWEWMGAFITTGGWWVIGYNISGFCASYNVSCLSGNLLTNTYYFSCVLELYACN